MHHVPQLGLTALAVAGPVERVVRPQRPSGSGEPGDLPCRYIMHGGYDLELACGDEISKYLALGGEHLGRVLCVLICNGLNKLFVLRRLRPFNGLDLDY